MANKVKFGLKNVHYALATIAANGSATYETPKAFPGAVSLSLDVQGDITPFRADNMDYYVSNGQNSYQGDLEMALFTDEVRQDLFGDMKEETSGLQYEVAGQEAKHFALMFQFEGDVHATRHVLYNCTATRPTKELQTIEDTKTPVTQTLTVSAVPLASGDVMGMTTSATPEATKSAWHNAVYIASGTANFLVQFNSMGGSAVQSQSVADGGKATEPTAPTKTGKTFDGWYSDLDLTVAWDFTTDTVDSDMMLYAKWS
jgi:phi13 family phage major tail protein